MSHRHRAARSASLARNRLGIRLSCFGIRQQTGGRKMLNNINVLLIMLGLAAPVAAQMDTGVGYPNVSIGINSTLPDSE
jgi:hypothetical protein